MKRRLAPVHWNFAPKPEPIPMVTLKSGQQIAKGVPHEARPEGYPKTTKVYCYGCKEYFPSWHHFLYRHGLCKDKPPRKK